MITHWSGWTGTRQNHTCANPTCNNFDGCSWITNRYDWWYGKNNCVDMGSGYGGECAQVSEWCHRVQTFFDDCEAPALTDDLYVEGGC